MTMIMPWRLLALLIVAVFSNYCSSGPIMQCDCGHPPKLNLPSRLVIPFQVDFHSLAAVTRFLVCLALLSLLGHSLQTFNPPDLPLSPLAWVVLVFFFIIPPGGLIRAPFPLFRSHRSLYFPTGRAFIAFICSPVASPRRLCCATLHCFSHTSEGFIAPSLLASDSTSICKCLNGFIPIGSLLQ
ncbi:hypothetical protein BO82DRAFT_214518 [Aspergillus uvarum CBS 121591]|uniref:Uncharacterized protein n=1 Tax=Aspergillus uvarum CBS 121591 TaxID=1448315 RepID=A0A319BU16_9EURO|nr:hypothetical protein BO82DRAFT_214518 [Aspergillus uvarum CBS 121591]PYH76215.1 hypothetical protein BO82DRAFT_214518 [Aspergillus uvarum CBS 121591]